MRFPRFLTAKMVMRPCVLALMLGASVGECSLKVHAMENPAKISVEKKSPEQLACPAAREFVTIFEFLRHESAYRLATKDARAVALEATKGCTGAARRFIRVANVLGQAGVDVGARLQLAADLARGSEERAEAFHRIFARLFARDGFDLDLAAALQQAKRLSLDLDHSSDKVLKDFERVAQFCLAAPGANLGRPQCAELSVRIALAGVAHDVEVGAVFVDAVEYLRLPKGPGLTLGDALRVAEELANVSPAALGNFRKTYEFASATSGLSLERAPAVALALDVAKLTVKE